MLNATTLKYKEEYIIGLNTNGEVRLFNSACEKVTGYNYNALAGKVLPSGLFPKEKLNVLKKLKQELTDSSRKKLQFTTSWGDKKGKAINISWSVDLIKVENEKIQLILFSGKNILVPSKNISRKSEQGDLLQYKLKTAQAQIKKLKKELADKTETESKYRMISDNNQDVITLRDSDFNSYFVSNSVRDILGYEPEEYRKISTQQLLPPEDHQRYLKIVNDFKNGSQKGLLFETRVLHKKGYYIWMQTVIRTVRNSNGDIEQIVASGRDITLRKKLEDEIRQQELKYRAMFENAMIAMFRGNYYLNKPLDANEQLIKLFGYANKQDFVKNFSYKNQNFDMNSELEIRKSLTEDSSVTNFKMKFTKKDGSEFYGDLSMKLLSPDGLVEGVIVDITEREAFEKKLHQNLTEKEMLLKEIHHRVKNNLQIICSLLSLQLKKIDDPKFRQPLIESHARIHAIALIHEKLYLSDDIATIDFSSYLSSLTKSMTTLNIEKRIAVTFQLEEYLTNINIAIPLGLVCYEIISNAFKHAFTNSQLGEIDISLKRSSDKTEIVIADSGSGFDINTLETSKTLGWKLISNLAKQAKAQVMANSKSGEGSRFTITLEKPAAKV